MTQVSAKDWSKKSILVAEDDNSNYLLLYEMLLPTKAKMIRAINGKEAITIYESSKNFDLILLDIKMPIMDGLETATYIRETDKETPIIAQTVYGNTEFQEKAKKVGFTEIIIKPIIQDIFLSTLAIYLEDN